MSTTSHRLHHTVPIAQYVTGEKIAICGRPDCPRPAFSESALQWSSESTLDASEIVRRKHKHQHAIHHHHYFHHHQAQKNGIRQPQELYERRPCRIAHQRSLSGGSAGQTTRQLDVPDGLYSRRVAVQNGFEGRRKVMMSKDDIILHQRTTPPHPKMQQEVHSDTEETAGDVCLECSEWLGRALLCSCQVPSSSSANSSPSQSANAATSTAIGAPSGDQAKVSTESTEPRSSSRHSSADRSDRNVVKDYTTITPTVGETNGVPMLHQHTTTAEINIEPKQCGLQGYTHHPLQLQPHHHQQRLQRGVQYQHP